MIIRTTPIITTSSSGLERHIIVAPLKPMTPADMQFAISLLAKEFAFTSAPGDIGPFPAHLFEKAGE